VDTPSHYFVGLPARLGIIDTLLSDDQRLTADERAAIWSARIALTYALSKGACPEFNKWLKTCPDEYFTLPPLDSE
jgi:hypothetical protein